MIDSKDTTSTRPYLIRALYEWCTDNGLTPYVAVLVDDSVRVPNEYVKDGEIVLNISFDATSSLKLGNDFIEFKARFAGTAREIMVPISRVIAIYARENGQGMSFPMLASQGIHVGSSGGTSGNTGPVALASVPSGGAMPSVGEQKAVDAKVVQLSPGSADTGSPSGKPPRPPAGPRPALKRVK
jgi:stringent starvation protein B